MYIFFVNTKILYLCDAKELTHCVSIHITHSEHFILSDDAIRALVPIDNSNDLKYKIQNTFTECFHTNFRMTVCAVLLNTASQP